MAQLEEPELLSQEKEAISEFREILVKAFGSRLRSFVLFGSKARGEKDPESDIDILLVVEGLSRDDEDKIYKIGAEISLKRDVVLSSVCFDTAEYLAQKNFPFLTTAEAEGYHYDVGRS